MENFRPGDLERFGLSLERLQDLNPRLVIVRISGWGNSGPYAHKPGFGTLLEAFTGFAEKNGFPDSPPLLPNMGMADAVCGLTGAIAALVALREAQRAGGKGQIIDVSLMVKLVENNPEVLLATEARDRLMRVRDAIRYRPSE